MNDQYFTYVETAEELEDCCLEPEPEPEPEPEVDQRKLTCFVYKLLKDKQLRRFAFEMVDDECFANLTNVFRKAKGITIKLVKNEKNRYRLHVSDGKSVFDVVYPDLHVIEKMVKTFSNNQNI